MTNDSLKWLYTPDFNLHLQENGNHGRLGHQSVQRRAVEDSSFVRESAIT